MKTLFADGRVFSDDKTLVDAVATDAKGIGVPPRERRNHAELLRSSRSDRQR
jgi:hypothetical protein